MKVFELTFKFYALFVYHILTFYFIKIVNELFIKNYFRLRIKSDLVFRNNKSNII